MDGINKVHLFFSIVFYSNANYSKAADSQLRSRGSAGSGESWMEQSARLFAREALARLGRNLAMTTTNASQFTQSTLGIQRTTGE